MPLPSEPAAGPALSVTGNVAGDSTGSSAGGTAQLRRGLSTRGALGINLIDMVGVGPFVTLPLIVGATGGPQAMLGWVLGALLSLCDGCVWSELGTAYPEAGGSYAYLKHLYGGSGPDGGAFGGLGRLLSFLYAFQLLLSAPLSIASGCLGFAQYLAYLVPWAARPWMSFRLLGVPVVLSGQTALAMGVCLLAAAALHREVSALGRVVQALGGAVIVALVAIIVTGFTHFHPALAFSFPSGAFHLDGRFVAGLGTGLLISAYDYWGYYNVCFLGAEVREPRRAIPRAVLGSVAIVGTLYLLMNVSVLGVLRWQTFVGADNGAASGEARRAAMAVFMRVAYPGAVGRAAAAAIVVLIAVAAAASVFALLLGYSRIPFAAARDGNFPAVFGRLSAGTGVPFVSLRVLAGVTLVCCLFRLGEVISTLVVIRIVFQFLLQGVAVLLPKHRRARREGAGFRMPLYPLPALLALAGFSFILLSRPNLWRELRPALAVLVTGLAVYWLRRRKSRSEHSRELNEGHCSQAG